VGIGETMRASGLGKVVKAGQGSKFKVGDVVRGNVGWAEFATLPDKDLELVEVPKDAELLDFMGPLGMVGMTAYFGLLDVGKLKAGETLVVSGAAGAVGSLVCQIGKIKGAKVIGLAGADDKCQWLERELGVDKALNYKSKNFAKEFKNAVGFLDVFFDNVGGEILDMALGRLNKNARVVLCGAISAYNAKTPRGLSAYLNLISQRGKIEGFMVFDYADQYSIATTEMAAWIREGKLKRKYHVVEGLENAPQALTMLYSGENTGKLMIKVTSNVPARL